jgi:hypothetical protein
MGNRFTKVTPVEYLPIDTSLMLKAGLAKDEQVQEGINAAQKGVDALANMKSSYTTDHNYVNSYYDGVMTNLREKVKNTASFNDPNFKSNINQVINGAIKDPTLWNVNRRNQVYDATVKTMQSNPKISNSYKTVWGNSYTKQDQLGNPGGTGMINIPSPFEQYDLNDVLLKGQSLINLETRSWDNGYRKGEQSGTIRNTVKIKDPNTGKETEVPIGRHELQAIKNINNDSEAMNQLLFDYKASRQLTFDDDYDAKDFTKYITDRINGYGREMDVNNTSQELGALDEYQQKKAIDKAYDDAEYLNSVNRILTTPTNLITINAKQDLQDKGFSINSDGAIYSTYNNLKNGMTPEQDKKLMENYKNKIKTLSESATDEQKLKYNNFATEEDRLNYVNDNQKYQFFAKKYTIPGNVVSVNVLSNDLIASAITGGLAIAEGSGDISAASNNSSSDNAGNTAKILENLGISGLTPTERTALFKTASISFNPVDFNNGFLPTFSISVNNKNITSAAFDQINNTMAPLTYLYKEVFENGKSNGSKIYFPGETGPTAPYAVFNRDSNKELKGSLFTYNPNTKSYNEISIEDLQSDLTKQSFDLLNPYAASKYKEEKI